MQRPSRLHDREQVALYLGRCHAAGVAAAVAGLAFNPVRCDEALGPERVVSPAASLAATLGDGPFARTGGWEKESNDFRAAISVAANYELTTLSWGPIWAPDDTEALELASPVNHVAQKSKPLLILHSDNDRSVPIDNALLMVEALRKVDAPHGFHRYPRMGHMGINEEVIERSREFIEQQSGR